MIRYEYIAVKVDFDIWWGKAKHDYLEILNEYGQQGWRFVDITSGMYAGKKSSRSIEIIFERPIEE